MRKIIIDDNIRGFANKYLKEMENECPNVIKDLEILRDNVIKFNPEIDNKIIENYINEIISDYPNLLITEPKDWNFKKYNKILGVYSDILTTEVKYNTKGKVSAGKSIEYRSAKLYDRIMFCLRYENARTILGEIHQEMGLKACIYCNTQPARSANRNVFYEMDHLKPQSKYPFLGTCFYNLQPSDGSCNKRKSDNPCDFQLYINDSKEELSPFRFLPRITGIEPNTKCIEIKFVGKNGKTTTESRQYNTTFHLEDLYAAYKDVVDDIYWQNYKMCGSMVAAYKATFGHDVTRTELTKHLLHCPYDESKIHEDVLRKLKVDTMKQLDDAGLLLKD